MAHDQIKLMLFSIAITFLLILASILIPAPIDSPSIADQFTITAHLYLPVALKNHPATATPIGPCQCHADLYNCTDFSTQRAAQTCYDHCTALGYGDIHRLDYDNDGIACENLS